MRAMSVARKNNPQEEGEFKKSQKMSEYLLTLIDRMWYKFAFVKRSSSRS